MHHGGRRGAHLQGGQVSSGTAGAVPPELQLAVLPVGCLQLYAEQQLGRGARADVAHYPHNRRPLLGGVCGGISGQLSGDVCDRSVSFQPHQDESFPTDTAFFTFCIVREYV